MTRNDVKQEGRQDGGIPSQVFDDTPGQFESQSPHRAGWCLSQLIDKGEDEVEDLIMNFRREPTWGQAGSFIFKKTKSFVRDII